MIMKGFSVVLKFIGVGTSSIQQYAPSYDMGAWYPSDEANAGS